MSRIYLIKPYSAKLDPAYLVRADNKSQAIRRVAENVLSCEVAEQESLVMLVASGTKVTDARAAQEEIGDE